MSQFKFVGSSETATRKITWPALAKALVIKASVIDGLSAPEAYAQGVQEFNTQVDESDRLPTELPTSYTNKNAGSVLYGMKQRFLKLPSRSASSSPSLRTSRSRKRSPLSSRAALCRGRPFFYVMGGAACSE